MNTFDVENREALECAAKRTFSKKRESSSGLLAIVDIEAFYQLLHRLNNCCHRCSYR